MPIFEGSRDKVVAVLLVKTIIALDPNDATPLRSIVAACERADTRKYCADLLVMPDDTPLYDLLNEFQNGKCTGGASLPVTL